MLEARLQGLSRQPWPTRSTFVPVEAAGGTPVVVVAGLVVPGAWVGGAALECYYHSFEQCWARASGISNICIVNPYYVPPAPRPRRSRALTRKRP